MKKQVVVIGLGRFGTSVCKELYRLGHEVLAIDTKVDRVDGIRDYSSHAVVANATDESELKSLGVRNFDHAIVAIGDNLQASVLCTLMLKEIGIAKVWVKARDLQHQKILEKVGADKVIQPENEMGIRVAQHMNSEKIIDYIDLSNKYSIIELVASAKVADKTLNQLNIREKYKCIVLAIKRVEEVNIAPLPNDQIELGDILVVMGHRDDLKRLEDRGI
ncbi:TrkA family potassium uptake protein [Planococcus shenhongbingii]|uniref:TrkA family potassium uptake protein n=1 Tax=Planococcus shenhongbingii TaxID=3058398 RepID=A0ABT8NC38_9BACL|nr:MULTISPECIES: TrkA family potassium uptake protein [unclassified Planococcus (in: firmicutes)]MDN7245284.1 TrkA family potassium uptake protein [Planococcus sp. N017]WKA58390.1 TrkA family potassium uptake protein [Planococcus sp. N016]